MDRSSVWRKTVPRDKKPFHDVLAEMLRIVPLALRSRRGPERVGELVMLLDILYLSKIPAAAAHSIAEENAGLPDWLIEAGQTNIAGRTAAVLDDLKSREDDPPVETPK